MTECGKDFGFEDNCEAVSYPMTEEDYRRWFHPSHNNVMIAFKLETDRSMRGWKETAESKYDALQTSANNN